jgi:hypothetical protein
MTKFHVLPTNEDFRALTDDQISLMIYSMQEDHRELELARKGLSVDSQYYDSDFDAEVWNKDVGDWEVLRDGHDPNDIARQVEEMTKEEERKNLAMKFDTLEEYEAFRAAGGQTARESEIDQYINKQIALAEEKAKRLNAVKKDKSFVDDQDRPEAQSALSDRMSSLDKATIDENIALFNDDDDFTAI